MEEKNPRYFLEKLMILPHRGAGTVNGYKAGEIIIQKFKEMGFSPTIVPFRTIEYSWVQIPAILIFLSISPLMIFGGQKLVAISILIMGISLFVGWPVRPEHVFRKLAYKQARDIYLEVVSQRAVKRTIVILAHYDSGREIVITGLLKLLNKSKIGKKFTVPEKGLPFIFSGPLFPVKLAIIGIVVSLFFSPISVLSFLVLVLVAMALFITEFASYVPGALDNGSGTAVVISLADYFKDKASEDTRLIFLCNDAEEASTGGFEEFFKHAGIIKEKTVFINIESVGEKNLVAGYGEQDYLGVSRYCDEGLFAKVDEVRERFGKIGQGFIPLSSDMSYLLSKGYKVATTIISLDNTGFADHYHQKSDTLENINFETLDLCHDFVVDLVEKFSKEDFGPIS